MAFRGVLRPEADIARRVREVVGQDVFISSTFDPHGNEDDTFSEICDMAFREIFPPLRHALAGQRARECWSRYSRKFQTNA